MTEDQANNTYQAMVARFQNLATRASQAASYIRPEILALPRRCSTSTWLPRSWQPFRLVLERIIRFSRTRSMMREEDILPCRARWPGLPARPFGSYSTPT